MVSLNAHTPAAGAAPHTGAAPISVRPYDAARDWPVLSSWAAVHWGAVHPDALAKRLRALPVTLSTRGWVGEVRGQARAMVWLYRTDSATWLLENLWRDPLAPARECVRAMDTLIAHGVAQAREGGAAFLLCTTRVRHVARRAQRLGAMIEPQYLCMLPLSGTEADPK